MNRRGFLKLTGQVGILAALPAQLVMSGPTDWSAYNLVLHDPTWDMEYLAWQCAATLHTPKGRVAIVFLIDEEFAVQFYGSVEAAAEKMLREKLESKEFRSQWLS